MEFQFVETVAAIGTAGATIALVILLYRTIKQMEVTVKLSQIQTEFRFRPWIGPSARIEQIIPSINEKIQFEISLRNFGEIPAENVTAKFTFDTKTLERSDVINNPKNSFKLGPMLPNMEKRYWFFFEPDHWEKVTSGNEKLFTSVYFEYDVNGKKNGYGLISEYVLTTNNFLHKDMWIDKTKS